MHKDCIDCPRAEEGIMCLDPYKPCADHRRAKSAEREAILNKIKVRTKHVSPSIPIRDYDWSAVDDNTYDGPGSPIGWGWTKQHAINDLIEQLQDR